MIDDVTAYLRSTLLLVRRRIATMTHWNIVIDVTRLDQLYNAVIFVTFVFYSVSWINLAISKHLVRRQHKRLQRRLAKLVKYSLSRVISLWHFSACERRERFQCWAVRFVSYYTISK